MLSTSRTRKRKRQDPVIIKRESEHDTDDSFTTIASGFKDQTNMRLHSMATTVDRLSKRRDTLKFKVDKAVAKPKTAIEMEKLPSKPKRKVCMPSQGGSGGGGGGDSGILQGVVIYFSSNMVRLEDE